MSDEPPWVLTSESLLVVGLNEYVPTVASGSSERLASDGRQYKVLLIKNAEPLVTLGPENDDERSCEKCGLASFYLVQARHVPICLFGAQLIYLGCITPTL